MMHLARCRLGQQVVSRASYTCVCRFASTQSTAASAKKPADDFETAEEMLRPASSKKGTTPLWQHHKKIARVSRYPTYDFDSNFQNVNEFVAGDGVPKQYENSWAYRLTILRGNAKSREEVGKAQLENVREMISGKKKPDARWFAHAIYTTGTAEQVDELYEIATSQGVVDNKLTSVYIYNMARRAGFDKAIEKYESVKSKADNDIHASGVAAYAKAMQGEKAREIYEELLKKSDLKGVPTHAHSSMMTFYFDHGDMRKGFEIFNNLDKNDGSIDVRTLTSLIRGHRLAGDIKAAQEAFNSIAKRNLTADINAHSEIIMAYARPGNNIGMMMEKLEEMKNCGYRPPHTLYNYVIRSMLEKKEYTNALMALDLQFREKSYPLDKHLVIRLARYFADIEAGQRVKEKTEYIIWVGRKAGLYTDDLFYLTTPHYDLMDEYYFRHHPEYDYPDELRKPYQFKEWDEYPVFYEEDLRNPFERKAHARMAQSAKEQGMRTWRAELPSFSEEYNVITMKPPTFQNWAKPQTAHEVLRKYDEKVELAWRELGTQLSAIIKEEHEAKANLQATKVKLETREQDLKARLERIRVAEEKGEEKTEDEIIGVKAVKGYTEEKVEEKVEEKKEAPAVTTIKHLLGLAGEGKASESKPEESKASETPKEVKISEEAKGAAAESKTEETKETTEAKTSEESKTSEEAKTSAEAKTHEQEAKTQEQEAKANESAETKRDATKDAETNEAKAKETPRMADYKMLKLEAERDLGEVQAQLKDLPALISGGERTKRYEAIYSSVEKCKSYDDILPQQERMNRELRAELVQQMRIARIKTQLNDWRHSPALVFLYSLDKRRLKELVTASKNAIEDLNREDEMIRNPVDKQFKLQHATNCLNSASKILKREEKYGVFDPLALPAVPSLKLYKEAKEESAPTTQQLAIIRAFEEPQFESKHEKDVPPLEEYEEMPQDTRVIAHEYKTIWDITKLTLEKDEDSDKRSRRGDEEDEGDEGVEEMPEQGVAGKRGRRPRRRVDYFAKDEQ